jgi:hypothetical protein
VHGRAPTVAPPSHSECCCFDPATQRRCELWRLSADEHYECYLNSSIWHFVRGLSEKNLDEGAISTLYPVVPLPRAVALLTKVIHVQPPLISFCTCDPTGCGLHWLESWVHHKMHNFLHHLLFERVVTAGPPLRASQARRALQAIREVLAHKHPRLDLLPSLDFIMREGVSHSDDPATVRHRVQQQLLFLLQEPLAHPCMIIAEGFVTERPTSPWVLHVIGRQHPPAGAYAPSVAVATVGSRAPSARHSTRHLAPAGTSLCPNCGYFLLAGHTCPP